MRNDTGSPVTILVKTRLEIAFNYIKDGVEVLSEAFYIYAVIIELYQA